jgi:hypothetical protein
MLDCFVKCIFPVLQHFYQEFELFIQLTQGTFLGAFELIRNLFQLVLEHLCFGSGRVYFLQQNLALLEELGLRWNIVLVADLMALVVTDDALGADVELAIFAEILGFLLRVLQTELLLAHVVLDGLLLLQLVLVVVEEVQDGEVLDQLLHIWLEVLPARRTGQYVRSSQIQQTFLAERMSAMQDAGDFVFVRVRFEANRAGDIHYYYYSAILKVLVDFP